MVKVTIKSEKLSPFEGFFSKMELFDSKLLSVIDSTLGMRCRLFGYHYSEIIRSLMSVYFCGGTCIEDMTFYIRANRCSSLYDDIFALRGWKKEELGGIEFELNSILVEKWKGKAYRLVIQRRKWIHLYQKALLFFIRSGKRHFEGCPPSLDFTLRNPQSFRQLGACCRSSPSSSRSPRADAWHRPGRHSIPCTLRTRRASSSSCRGTAGNGCSTPP